MMWTMRRNLVIFGFSLAAITFAFSLQAYASILYCKAGAAPGSSGMHTIIYTDKIGTMPIRGGSIEINGQSISVFGRTGEFGDRVELLNGQLVKTKLYSDKSGAHVSMHIKGIAYFTEGKLLQDQTRTPQKDIVFVEGGFIGGTIVSVTPSSVVVNEQGVQRSIPMETVHGIRSPRAYNLQLDMSPLNVSDSENGDQYNVTSCYLHETVPPRMISSQSIAHPAGTTDDDDDLDEPLDDMLQAGEQWDE